MSGHANASGAPALSAGPLVAAVESRGGLGRLLAGRRSSREGRRAARAYARARVSGRMSVAAGDQLACRLLWTHPVEVWGEAFWQAAPAPPSRDQGGARPRRVTGADDNDEEEADSMAKRLDPPGKASVSPLAQQAGHAMRAAWMEGCDGMRRQGGTPRVEAHEIPWPQLGQAAVDAIVGRVNVEQRRGDAARLERLLSEVTGLLRGLRDATVAPRPHTSLAFTRADEYLRALDDAAERKAPAA